MNIRELAQRIPMPTQEAAEPLAQGLGLKRAMDVILTLPMLVLTLPIGLVIAAAIKLDSKGPVLFSQDQLGREGRRIRPLKFRSMYLDAEARLQHLLEGDPALAEEYRAFHKLRKDPRVTPVGRWLRKTSLDELPQLWNVLLGDMSLVGPRPYLFREVPEMEGAEATILQAMPGLTGYWQVEGRNLTTFKERLAMDLHYVRHRSFRMDLSLLLKTVLVVLARKGAY